MKVRIRGIEIDGVTLDELGDLIERYGSVVEDSDRSSAEQNGGQNNKHIRGNQRPADRVLLVKFTDAGSTGVPTADIGEVLGRRGKAMRGAVTSWAQRIGLVDEGSNQDPFEECRVGTKRGLRIKDSLMAVAKELL